MMFCRIPPFFKYPDFEWLNYFSFFHFQPEPKDNPRLVHSLYQTKYLQNYELLKEEYKITVLPTISFVQIQKYLNFPTESKGYIFFSIFKINFIAPRKKYTFSCVPFLSMKLITIEIVTILYLIHYKLFILFENFIRTLTTGIISLNYSPQSPPKK